MADELWSLFDNPSEGAAAAAGEGAIAQPDASDASVEAKTATNGDAGSSTAPPVKEQDTTKPIWRTGLIPRALDQAAWRALTQKQVQDIAQFIKDPSQHKDITAEVVEGKRKYTHRDGLPVGPLLFQSHAVELSTDLESRGGQRGIVATRDIQPGEILLIERTRWPLKTTAECKANDSRPEMEFVQELMQDVPLAQVKSLLKDMAPLYPQDWSQIDESHRKFLERVYGDAVDALMKNISDKDKARCDAIGLNREAILRLICVIHFDAFPKGICLHMAMVNHNCNPNAVKIGVKVKLAKNRPEELVHELRACRFIPKGEEVCINYIPTQAIEAGDQTFRLAYLERQFQFTCTCDVCVEQSRLIYSASASSPERKAQLIHEMKLHDDLTGLVKFYWRDEEDRKLPEDKKSETKSDGPEVTVEELFDKCIKGYESHMSSDKAPFPILTLRAMELRREQRRNKITESYHAQFTGKVAAETEEVGKQRGWEGLDMNSGLKNLFTLARLTEIGQQIKKLLPAGALTADAIAKLHGTPEKPAQTPKCPSYPTVCLAAAVDLYHTVLYELLQTLSGQLPKLARLVEAGNRLSSDSTKMLLDVLVVHAKCPQVPVVSKGVLITQPESLMNALQRQMLDSALYLLHRQALSSRYDVDPASGPSPNPGLLECLERVQGPLQIMIGWDRGNVFKTGHFALSVGRALADAQRLDHAIQQALKEMSLRYNTGSPLISAE